MADGAEAMGHALGGCGAAGLPVEGARGAGNGVGMYGNWGGNVAGGHVPGFGKLTPLVAIPLCEVISSECVAQVITSWWLQVQLLLLSLAFGVCRYLPCSGGGGGGGGAACAEGFRIVACCS